jgi:hypothetical protein
MTGPGRPSTGVRVDVRIPADVLAELDDDQDEAKRRYDPEADYANALRHVRRGRPSVGVRVDVRIPAYHLETIDYAAKQRGWSRAETIRDALDAYCSALEADREAGLL